MRWDRLVRLCAATLCLLLAPPALAGFTTINPPHPGEDSHQEILSNIYGGMFVPVGERGVDFSNGSTLALRVDDTVDNDIFGSPGSPLEMGGPTGGDDGTDQFWKADFVLATAEAKFAAYAQNFGFFMGTGPEVTYNMLFNLTGSGYEVTGEADLRSLSGQTIRWGRGGGPPLPGGGDRILSSRISDNPDEVDHMVTYQILPADPTLGEDPPFRWLIFWEDILKGEQFEDFDFNDLVVEINAIPEPASLGLIGLFALAGLRRRR